MGGIIHAYYDCVSPYSYFAFIHLKRVRDILASHGVSIEIHPIFLGGVMAGSGNKPPWTVPAKGKMSKFETKRAMGYLKIKPFEMPKSFPIVTILPQRTLTYIKHVYPQNKFERSVELYWEWFFYQHQDLSKPDVLRQLLATPETGFTAEEAETIMSAATEQKWKDALTAKTQEALDRGAFGAPFFWVVKLDEQGNMLKEEPFFGSDRFHQMWDYLDLPYNDIKVLERDGAKL